jgi:hypothetical protein
MGKQKEQEQEESYSANSKAVQDANLALMYGSPAEGTDALTSADLRSKAHAAAVHDLLDAALKK